MRQIIDRTYVVESDCDPLASKFGAVEFNIPSIWGYRELMRQSSAIYSSAGSADRGKT